MFNYLVTHHGILDVVTRTKISHVERAFADPYLKGHLDGMIFAIDAEPCRPVNPTDCGHADSQLFYTAIVAGYGHDVSNAWLGTDWRESLWGLNSLQSIVEPAGIDLDIREIVDHFATFRDYHGVKALAWQAGTLLVIAYELAKGLMGDTPKTPEWEFLRHCRNASGHGGKVSFKGKEPVVPAYWRGIQITRSMQNTPLINFNNEGEYSRSAIRFCYSGIWNVQR